MKTLKYALLAATALFMSCSSDDNNTSTPVNETDGLTLVKTIQNDTHTLNLFTQNGELTEGYNEIFIQIKDAQDNFLTDASLSWSPLMYMHNMQHSCPFSEIAKVQGKQTLYKGYIVFQMAGNSSEYWKLTFDYTLNGTAYQASGEIDVFQSDKRRVNSFMGSDNERYIIALVEPNDPQVAINDMVVGIFRMENMMNFPVVDDYTLKIDPRMPGMGNHGSPNNIDLAQSTDGFYHGKLSLTMTGYWKVNLMLENQNGETLKGEPITDTNESSSLFFEIEF
ncbi:MAG: hypothetical protein WCY89_10240 [Flavobacteriaceae bacterium]